MNRREKATRLFYDIIKVTEDKYWMHKGQRNDNAINFLIKCRKLYLHLLQDNYIKSFNYLVNIILKSIEIYNVYSANVPGNYWVDIEWYLRDKLSKLNRYWNRWDRSLDSYLIAEE